MLDIVDCFAGGILAKLASFISSSSRIPLTEHWEYWEKVLDELYVENQAIMPRVKGKLKYLLFLAG